MQIILLLQLGRCNSALTTNFTAIIFYFKKVQAVKVSFFFFQAEDGIRDPLVTGVQTCALPILQRFAAELITDRPQIVYPFAHQIGRASCRERVEISVVAVSLKKKQTIVKP